MAAAQRTLAGALVAVAALCAAAASGARAESRTVVITSSSKATAKLPEASLCYVSGYKARGGCGCEVDGEGGHLRGCDGCAATCIDLKEGATDFAKAKVRGVGVSGVPALTAVPDPGQGQSGCLVKRTRSNTTLAGAAGCEAKVLAMAPGTFFDMPMSKPAVPDDVKGLTLESHICVLAAVKADGDYNCFVGLRDGKKEWRMREPFGDCEVRCFDSACPCGEKGKCVDVDAADGLTNCSCDSGIEGPRCNLLEPHHNSALVTSLFFLVTLVAVAAAFFAFARHKWTTRGGRGAEPYAQLDTAGSGADSDML